MRHHHTTNDDDFEIINGKKCLRDGHRYRAGPITMMDSMPRDGHGPVRITDGSGDGGLGLHRPGYRQFNFDDAAGRIAKEQAYQEYRDALVSAYKSPPAGAYPLSAGEGTACTIDDRPGPLVRQGNVLVCTSTSHDARSDEDEDDSDKNNGDDEDEDDEENERPARRHRRWQERDRQGRERGTVTEEDSLAQRMSDHQANMERIYQDRDYELTQAWRNPR